MKKKKYESYFKLINNEYMRTYHATCQNEYEHEINSFYKKKKSTLNLYSPTSNECLLNHAADAFRAW